MAVDMFLKIEGVPGESTDKAHPQEIHVNSLSWGIANPYSPATGSGQPSFQDLSIGKYLDKASPLLMLACCTGKPYPTAVITIRKSSGSTAPVDWIKITLTNAVVSSIQDSAAGEVPQETVTLAFTKYQIAYGVFDALGRVVTTVHMGWDLAKNTKI